MDYETAARRAARAELARLSQTAVAYRRAVAGRIIGIEVTVLADGSSVPDLAGVICAHMVKRAERKARP